MVAVLVVDRQLGGAMLAQQHVQGHLALHCFEHLHAGRHLFGHQGTYLAELFGRDQISLGQHHQIGGRELVFEQLMQAGVRVEIGIGLTLFIKYSRTGQASRACSQDLRMANLLGIDTGRIISFTFMIGAIHSPHLALTGSVAR